MFAELDHEFIRLFDLISIFSLVHYFPSVETNRGFWRYTFKEINFIFFGVFYLIGLFHQLYNYNYEDHEYHFKYWSLTILGMSKLFLYLTTNFVFPSHCMNMPAYTSAYLPFLPFLFPPPPQKTPFLLSSFQSLMLFLSFDSILLSWTYSFDI